MPSELIVCGLTDATLTYLERLGFDKEEIFASFLFLRTGGNYVTVSDHLTAKFKRGWSEKSCATKIPEFFQSLYKDLRQNWLEPRNDILFDNSNGTDGFLSDDVRMVVDTVPLYVDALDDC